MQLQVVKTEKGDFKKLLVSDGEHAWVSVNGKLLSLIYGPMTGWRITTFGRDTIGLSCPDGTKVDLSSFGA
jgi:hypothetical protein